MKILAIDPSGNFTEGKGTTGWSLLDENMKILACGQILANNYKCKEAYWDMPTGETCPKCSSMLTTKKDIVKCSSCDYVKN